MAITGTVNTVGNDSSSVPTEPIPGAVLYTPQFLTETQQAQALANIGAVSRQEINEFVRGISFDEQTGDLVVETENGERRIETPILENIRDVRLDHTSLVVDFNDGRESRVFLLPSNTSPVYVNNVAPDANGNIRIGIANIANLTEDLASRATITDINNLRGLKFVPDQGKKTFKITDAAGVELTALDVSWLTQTAVKVNNVAPDANGNIKIEIANISNLNESLEEKATITDVNKIRGLKFVADENKQAFNVLDGNDSVLSIIDVSWLMAPVRESIAKTDVFILEEKDFVDEYISLELTADPNIKDFVFVFCNNQLIDFEKIIIDKNTIKIQTKDFIDIKVGVKIAVAYKHF